MDPISLRCSGDDELMNSLLEDELVKRVIDRLDDENEKNPANVRRRLLATALRLTPQMSPTVHRITEHCRERLGIKTPLETYVYAGSDFNAACVKPEDGRLFMLLSSSLLEAFPEPELCFVIGHELGHHLFEHHDLPIAAVFQSGEVPSPGLVLRLFSWSRYAEISADRAGAYCADNYDAVASSLFRLASGLRGNLVTIEIDAFAQQADDMQLNDEDPTKRASESEWFTTHPFSPLRVKALKAFSASELAVEGGCSVDELEAQIQTLMSLMEPSYLDEKSETAETMRRLLLAGSVVVAAADGDIAESEIEVFESFFGEHSFTDKLDVEELKKVLPRRIEETREAVASPKRVQVLRDLCLVARADGHNKPAEIDVLEEIAKGLGVERLLITQMFDADLSPD